MSITKMWRWLGHSLLRPATPVRTMSGGSGLLLRPATSVRIIALYGGIVVLFWLMLSLL
jgi:hypothetical protein